MKNKTKFIIFLIIAVISLAVVVFVGILNYNVSSVKSLILSYKSFSILIYIILIAIAAATTLPITATLIAGMLVFSFTESLLYAFLGIYIGAFVMYIISLKTGRGALMEYSHLGKGKLKVLNMLIHENSFSLVLFLNFVYFFPSNLAHMIAGATNLDFKRFSFATIIGNFSNTFSVALLIFGLINMNYNYVITAIIFLILITGIPLYVYRRHFRDIIVIAFSKKAWKSFKKIEKAIE